MGMTTNEFASTLHGTTISFLASSSTDLVEILLRIVNPDVAQSSYSNIIHHKKSFNNHSSYLNI
jgi:hypothetical protein